MDSGCRRSARRIEEPVGMVFAPGSPFAYKTFCLFPGRLAKRFSAISPLILLCLGYCSCCWLNLEGLRSLEKDVSSQPGGRDMALRPRHAPRKLFLGRSRLSLCLKIPGFRGCASSSSRMLRNLQPRKAEHCIFSNLEALT